jgi:hypothetical protein
LHRSQEISAAIRHLRTTAARGALPSELLAFVSERSDKRGLRDFAYLGDVFLVGSRLMYTFPGIPFTEEGERRWRTIIEETRGEWENQKLPEPH